jgi:flagellar L-ring protein precursor FlgH
MAAHLSAAVLLLTWFQVPVLPGQARAVTAASAMRSAKDPAAGSLEEYLVRVRATSAENRAEPGAIWTDGSRFSRLSADVRAMQVHDLVSVVVSEALESSTDGTVKGSRTSAASSAITSLFQKLSAGSAAQNLVNMNAQSALSAQGQSANNSSLSTVLGGEVVEVLPNGMLMIEAARQVEFSQQTQTVVLRGLVRPEDISQSNRILSTSISDLTLQVRGHGIVSDYTHRSNALVRLLQKAFIF